MTFLTDLTDERFKIPVNRAVIEYIQRENPFAHSDIGAVLIRLARLVPGAQYYCPSFSSLAYVVLHTKANLIFAIAIGMLKIDFRLPPALVSEAQGSGRGAHSDIGADWLSIRPFPRGEARSAVDARLSRCGATPPTNTRRRWPAIHLKAWHQLRAGRRSRDKFRVHTLRLRSPVSVIAAIHSSLTFVAFRF
jgi:hypothetical protein